MKNENKPFRQNCYEKIEEAIKRKRRTLKKSVDFFLGSISLSKTDFLKITTKMLPKHSVSAEAVRRGADTSAVSMTLEKNVSVYKENKITKNRNRATHAVASIFC